MLTTKIRLKHGRPLNGHTFVLSKTRVKIMGMILKAYLTGSHTPSVSEMMKATKRSPHAVSIHLNTLASDGLIKWEAGKARTIRPTCQFIPADQL